MTENQRAICDYEGSDYQKSFWEQGEREYEDRVEAVALRRLLPTAGTRLLDIGAGAGRNVPRYGKFEQVVLLDYARTQLEQAQERLGESDRYLYVVADAYHLPFACNVFDTVVMVRTLHHMIDPQAALKQARGVSADGSSFILEFANKRNLKSILRWVSGRQEWNPYKPDPVEFAKLNYNFHPQSVRDWLEAAQFRIDRQLTVSHFRMNILKKLIPVKLLIGLDAMLQWTGKLWQLTPSVFVRSMATGESAEEDRNAFWRCPACASIEMEESENGVQCEACGRFWAKNEGIYDFRTPHVAS